MEERTELKEKRNSILWVVWFILAIGAGVWYVRFDTRYPDEDVFFFGVLGFTFLTIIYRCLTYALNCLILLFLPRKKFKIKRLKGRVTPIYKISSYDFYNDYVISKFAVEDTDLGLQWSLPFSVIFQEQEYICQGSYDFEGKIEDIKSLEELWESKHRPAMLKVVAEVSAKTLKKQKIDNLNKQFKENYK